MSKFKAGDLVYFPIHSGKVFTLQESIVPSQLTHARAKRLQNFQHETHCTHHLNAIHDCYR